MQKFKNDRSKIEIPPFTDFPNGNLSIISNLSPNKSPGNIDKSEAIVFAINFIFYSD